jgi:large subunit ribosomal protein L10
MNKDQKAAVVDEIAAQISEAQAVIAVDYRGTSVPQAAELRAKLRDADTTFRIVKNSLTERAAAKAGADTLKALLEGPTAFAFVHGDPAAAAKALNDFTRELDSFQFKGGVMDGTPLSVDELKVIARLPTREVLDAQLVGMVASPLTGLVRGLNGLISGLALQLGQIAEQRAAEPEAPDARRPTPDAPAEEPDAADAQRPTPDAPAEEPDAADAQRPTPDAPEEPSTDNSEE